MMQHLQTARAEKEAQKQRQIECDLELVEDNRRKLELEKQNHQMKREELKRTMEENFQENARARRKHQKEQKEQRKADYALMKAYEERLADEENARTRARDKREAQQREFLEAQQKGAVVDHTQQEASRYMERSANEQ